MLPGPIFRVELVAAARRRRYFALRVAYAAIILFVLWTTYSNVSRYNRFAGDGTASSISELARTASAFFYAFSWVQLIGIIALAPVMAVGTIATERERRTIEYLFATDLSNLEIVLGKTFARLMLIGQLVMVSLPILFIFRLLGGIPANLLAASFLIAASTALLLTSLSVAISVWSQRARDGAMRVYRVVAALLVLPLFAAPLMPLLSRSYATWWSAAIESTVRFLWEINPLYLLGSSMSGVFAVGAGFDFDPVLRMAGWHLVFSVALAALATVAVRRVHLRDSGRGQSRKSIIVAPPWQRYRWKPLVGDRAMIWKEAFAPTAKTKLGLVGAIANGLVVIVVFGWTLWMFWLSLPAQQGFVGANTYFYFAATLTGFLGAGLLLLLSARAAGLITIEKERDCWISLLSTPLSGGEIMRGKMIGNLYSARWGFLLLFTAWVLGAFFEITFLAVVPVLAATYFLCAAFVTNVGLYYSLRSKTSLRAMGLTLATVIFIGGGYLFCCCFVAAGAGANDDLMAIGLAPCMPFLLAAPTMMFVDQGMNESELVVGYCLGLIGYLIACGSLMGLLASNFDAFAGRTTDVPDGAGAE